MRTLAFLFAALILACPMTALAQDHAETFQHHGVLTLEGRPFTGDALLRFEIFNVRSADSPIYMEEERIQVVDGYYAAVIGDAGADPLDLDIFRDAAAGNLELQVTFIYQDQEYMLSPRQPLRSVPFALGVAQGAINARALADGAVTSAKLATGAVTRDAIAAGAIGSVSVEDGSLTTDDIADGTIEDADINPAAGILISRDRIYVNRVFAAPPTGTETAYDVSCDSVDDIPLAADAYSLTTRLQPSGAQFVNWDSTTEVASVRCNFVNNTGQTIEPTDEVGQCQIVCLRMTP